MDEYNVNRSGETIRKPQVNTELRQKMPVSCGADRKDEGDCRIFWTVAGRGQCAAGRVSSGTRSRSESGAADLFPENIFRRGSSPTIYLPCGSRRGKL